MALDLWQQVQQIFDAALQQSPEKRQEFLEQECGSNQELRREVESLLAAHDESGSFMAQPAVAGVAQVLHRATSRFQPGDTLGAYKILDLVGRGGMGEVYRARDTRLKRDVAIKVLPQTFAADRERLRRFEQEARSAAALNHPNIISVHDMGTADGSPYIVSELLEGQNLREVLRQGAVPARKALDYAIQTARGLAAAHDVGITHRDLKPENLFITKDGRLKILDFGLAKLTRPEGGGSDSTTAEAVPGTEAGRVFGTVGYMSPEQVRGQCADHRSDIFSFGAILYELFSGKRAFSGDSPADTMSAILHQDPPELTGATPPVHPAVDHTIRHCLEKNPLERYQSAHDLAFHLQVAAEGLFHKAEAPIADRSLLHLKSLLPLKQHKLGIAGGLLAVLIVLAAAGFSVYSIFHRVTPIAFRNFTVAQVANSGRAELAAISPDGRYLLNVQNEDGKESLWLRNVPTSSDTQVLPLSASFYTSLAFSPDGNYIYYREAANKFLSGFNLYRAPVLGGTPRLIVENIDTAVTFSPDGSRMAFARWHDPDLGKNRLIAAKPDGTDEQVLRIGSYYPVLMSVAWSPDGKRIACSLLQPDDKASGIDIFDIATGQMRRFVRFDDKFALDIKWLPNGRGLIVLYKEKSGRGTQIGFVAYPGGQFRTITNDTNSYSAFSLSADGRTLATVQEERSSEISILSGTGGGVATSIPRISRRTVIHDVTWARDGKLLISEDNRLVHMASDGSGAVTVLNDSSAWIPEVESCVDGRSIVVSWLFHAGTNSENVWRTDVNGSNLVRLSNGKEDASPVCSPDGKWVYFIDAADSRVMRVSIGGGTPEQVRASVVHNAILYRTAISPDGRMLVYAFSGVEGPGKHTVFQKLAIVNLTMNSDTPPRLLDIDPRASLFVQFTPDGKNVAYPIEDKGIGNIWLQPIDGSKGRQITNFNFLTISGFHWSPDGKSLIVHRTQQTSDVVLLRESENADLAESVR